MTPSEALPLLEEMLELVEDHIHQRSGPEAQERHRRLVELYGAVEPVIEQVVGKERIPVPLGGGGAPASIFQNYIEAGFLSGRTFHSHQGKTQLIKVIGRVKQMANDRPQPRAELTLRDVSVILRRFRECCQFLKVPPENERAVQDVIWIMLRSHFDRLDRENTLPQFGAKGYRPDFGIPDLKALIEIKYIGQPADVKKIQEEILADIQPYTATPLYNSVVVVVYDAAHALRDPTKFISDLSKVEGIADVIVIPGIGQHAE